jgi:hypothetical protein
VWLLKIYRAISSFFRSRIGRTGVQVNVRMTTTAEKFETRVEGLIAAQRPVGFTELLRQTRWPFFVCLGL